jgi:hypothetical protein
MRYASAKSTKQKVQSGAKNSIFDVVLPLKGLSYFEHTRFRTTALSRPTVFNDWRIPVGSRFQQSVFEHSDFLDECLIFC